MSVSKNYKAMTELAERLITDTGKNLISMSDVEVGLINCPEALERAENEIVRLRALVLKLAKNELSESEKKYLLCDVK